MEKTPLQYLQERRYIALNNQFRYARDYLMDSPREGCEEQFAEALHDVEIVEDLILLVEIVYRDPPKRGGNGLISTDDVYLSLLEAAQLEGLTYAGMASRIKRHPDHFVLIRQPQPDGGKPRVLIALPSLSVKARVTYRKTQLLRG